jgi:hypothetical protein
MVKHVQIGFERVDSGAQLARCLLMTDGAPNLLM